MFPSSSVSKFYKKCKMACYRRSGGRSDLSEHVYTQFFKANPNFILSGASLAFPEDLSFEVQNLLLGGESNPNDKSAKNNIFSRGGDVASKLGWSRDLDIPGKLAWSRNRDVFHIKSQDRPSRSITTGLALA